MASTRDEHIPISRLSLRRKSNQINISILCIIVLTVLITVFTYLSWDRTLIFAIGILTVLLVVFTAYRLITVGLRAVALEVWIRLMGEGNLEHRVEMKGQDEIVELAIALEALRQRSIKALQLDLVQKLSKDIQEKNRELEKVLQQLRQTQDQIIVRRKLVELGALTAGVAHEIRNPLNFMRNFSESSKDLLDELRDALLSGPHRFDEDNKSLIASISRDLATNLDRIKAHGDRVDRIVEDMLMIGRGGGDIQPTDINDLLRDRASMACHSAEAADPRFRLAIETDFDPSVGEVSIVPEDLARVFLNVVVNSCYATAEKDRSPNSRPGSYAPTLWLKTRLKDDVVEIAIRDNGVGIPPDVMEKIFNPFFTTKRPGAGTGLGLSLSNDIIREHGGSMTPLSRLGEYTEMLITIPLSRPASHSTPTTTPSTPDPVPSLNPRPQTPPPDPTSSHPPSPSGHC